MSFLSARNKAGLSQAVVADKLGIKPASVSQWENGKTMPNADRLLEIAALYECTVEELLLPDTPTN